LEAELTVSQIKEALSQLKAHIVGARNMGVTEEQLQGIVVARGDSWMQHLAIHTQEQPGATNEWLEPVNDTQYNSLQ
jgi:hypothetical protein